MRVGSPPVPVFMGQGITGGETDTLAVFGLGSCVALALWDSSRRVGFLGHIVLPRSTGMPARPNGPAHYADLAVPWALERLAELNCRPCDLVAKLTGGASLFDIQSSLLDVGARNVEAVTHALADYGIPVTSALTGGAQGRTVRFMPADGRLHIRTASGEDDVL